MSTESTPHQHHIDKLERHDTQISKLQSDLTRLDTNLTNVSHNIDKIVNSVAKLTESTKPTGTNWPLFISIIAFIFTISGTVLSFTNGVFNDKLNISNQNIKELQVEMKQHNDELHQIQVDALKVQIENLKSTK